MPHNDATIARWLLKQASFDTVTHLTTVAEVRAFEKRAEIAVLAFGDDGAHSGSKYVYYKLPAVLCALLQHRTLLCGLRA